MSPKDPVAVRGKWHGFIKALAEEFSCLLSKFEQILGTEWHQLEQGAKVKDFIPVLAVKQVRNLLRTLRPTPG